MAKPSSFRHGYGFGLEVCLCVTIFLRQKIRNVVCIFRAHHNAKIVWARYSLSFFEPEYLVFFKRNILQICSIGRITSNILESNTFGLFYENTTYVVKFA